MKANLCLKRDNVVHDDKAGIRPLAYKALGKRWRWAKESIHRIAVHLKTKVHAMHRTDGHRLQRER